MRRLKLKLDKGVVGKLPFILFVAFSVLFTLGVTIGPKLDYDV